jgi:hypothetical protein
VRRTSDSRRAAIIETYSPPMRKPSIANESPMPNGSFTSTSTLPVQSLWAPASVAENPERPKKFAGASVFDDSELER